MGVRVEEFYMGEEREARQGWLKLRVGDFGTQRTRVAESHYARAGVALLSGGKGYGNDEKGVEVGDNVIVDTVFDRNCEPRRRKKLACNYTVSRCSTGGVVQPIAGSSHPLFSIQPQRRQMPALSRVVAQWRVCTACCLSWLANRDGCYPYP